MSDESLLIVGSGALYERVSIQWRIAQPARDIHLLEVVADEIATLPAGLLAEHAPVHTRIFAAMDATALNFARFDLYSKLRLMGYRADTFIHPKAVIDTGAKVAENCYVGEGAIVGTGTRVAHNCFIGAGANVGVNTRIGHSSWLDAGVICGDKAGIGQHVVLGSGVVIAPGVTVGAHCDIEIPGHYTTDTAAQTFLHPLFGHPVFIYSA